MVVFTAFGLSRLVAALLSIVAVAAITTPASARSLHRHHVRASHRYHVAHYRAYHHHHRFYAARRHGWRHSEQEQGAQFAQPSFGFPSGGATAMAEPQMHRVAQRRYGRRHVAQAQDVQQSQWQSWSPSGAGSSIVAEARSFIGRGNPTGRRSLWCARFMNMVLRLSGHRGTGSDMASSFAHYGQRVSGPQVGAIAVMSRRGGGHVGVVSGVDAHGNPIVVSGNHGHRVAEAVYSKSRVYAYVMPSS